MPLLSKTRFRAIEDTVMRAITTRPPQVPSGPFMGRKGWNAHDVTTLDPEQLAVALNVHLDDEERVSTRGGFTA